MELRPATPEQLETVYDADLKVSFPAAELKPLRIIQRMLEDGYYRPWCLFDGAEIVAGNCVVLKPSPGAPATAAVLSEIVGECFLWLGEPGWALLDYLCISPRCRNGGLGALLLEKMLEAEPGVVILGESEMPEYAPDPAMAQRRLGFYARNHARLAGYDTEMFGVPYKTLYWADAPVSDQRLIEAHRAIYLKRFSPEKFARYVRIPREPNAKPLPQVAWNE